MNLVFSLIDTGKYFGPLSVKYLILKEKCFLGIGKLKVLNDSNIGYLLEGLLLRKDIQNYFSIILTDIIEAYENSEESSKPFLFKISESS